MSNRFFEGLFVGGLFGFVWGVLSAPKTGAELRKQIVDESEDLYKHASESITDIKSKANQTIANVQSKSEDFIKKASEHLPGKKEPAEF